MSMNGDEYLAELHKLRQRMRLEMKERGISLREYLDEALSKLPPVRIYTVDELQNLCRTKETSKPS